MLLLLLLACTQSPEETTDENWKLISSPVPGYTCYEYSRRANAVTYQRRNTGVACFPSWGY